jgi:hypothetical protein
VTPALAAAALVVAITGLAAWPGVPGLGPAHAGHAGAGNCPHAHDPTDPSFSSCNPGVGGKKRCLIDGFQGKCQQQLIDEPFTDVRGPACLCVTDADSRQALQISRMANAMDAALKTPQVLSALGALGTAGHQVACTQYNTAIREFLLAKGGLVGLGPITWYDARLLAALDGVILNLATLASQANSLGSQCASVGVSIMTISIPESLSQVAQKKLEMSQSFGRLIE